MGLLDGKVVLLLNITNKFSYGWGIAQSMHREGARLTIGYQGERTESSTRRLAETLPGADVVCCDVEHDDQIDAAFAQVEREAGGLDVLVHSLAYAPTEALQGRYVDTTREAFRRTLD